MLRRVACRRDTRPIDPQTHYQRAFPLKIHRYLSHFLAKHFALTLALMIAYLNQKSSQKRGIIYLRTLPDKIDRAGSFISGSIWKNKVLSSSMLLQLETIYNGD